jgi:hypothetical protein
MSYPNSPVNHLELAEYWLENCGEVCQTGRASIGTYVVTA